MILKYSECFVLQNALTCILKLELINDNLGINLIEYL